MKKLYIIAFLAIALIVTSCHSDLDVSPQTSLTQKDIDRLMEEDMEMMLSGQLKNMYSSMQRAYMTDPISHSHKGVDITLSYMGNDLCMHISGYIGWRDYTVDFRSETFYRTDYFWSQFYHYIANSNRLLRQLPAEESELNSAGKNGKATALAFRGMSYFYLANLYQFPYSDATKSLPGVPLQTEEVPYKEDCPRSTLEETYQQSLSDLMNAQRLFTEIGKVKGAPTEMDATTCALYLARAYQAMGNFVEAEKQADIVIANYPVLTGREQLWHGFNDVDMPNVVLGYRTTIETRKIYNSHFSNFDPYCPSPYVNGIPKFAFNGLIDKIDVNDDRFFWWTSVEASAALGEGPGTIPMIRDTPYRVGERIVLHTITHDEIKYVSVKFIGTGRDNILKDPTLRDGQGTLDFDLGDEIYLRSEEAYLVKAEALAQQDKLSEAKTALENFVKTRNATYVCPVSSKQDLIDEIQVHKRIEFWCEGIEYLDNRRLGVPIDRKDKPGFVSNHFPSAKLRIEQTDRRFVFQLPRSEMQTNTEFGPDDQNP